MTSDSTPVFALEKEALKTEIETGLQVGVDHLEDKPMKRKPVEKYHNTRHLLKQYRKVAYAIQISESDMNVRMEMEHGTRLSTLEVNAELAGVDLSGSKLEGYTQTEKGLSDIMASISHEHVNQYTGELLPPSPAAAPYAIFKQSSDTVRTSVIIGLGSKLAVLQAQQVRNITSYNEIDLELPGKQKCAYFCIVSDQDSTFDFLSSLFFSFLFIRLIRYADGYCEGGMLSTKVKFVLDEFPNCCLIPDFTKKCSTIRSRGCSVAVFFQNVGQMRNRYPDDQWQEILGACDSTVFLGCTDMLTAEYFSDRIGTASVEVEGTMRELNTMHITNYTPRFRKTNSLGRRQLLTPDEVLRLPPDQVLIFIRGQKVMRAKRYDYSLHPDYKKLKSRKAILHEPDWKTSQASSVSATGPSPSSSMATPVEKGSGNRQKKPPAKPAHSTEREVVNADDIF